MMDLWVPLALAVIAFLYASVGHGGASGYLAVLAFLGMAPAQMRPTALVLNLIVSAIAFVQFARAGHFRWSTFWPFALSSVPCAWIGARVELDPIVYKRLLAVCLLFAVGRMLSVFDGASAQATRPAPLPLALLIGGVLGLVSGMIGIGGGILLSPLLLLCHWSTAKEGAAVSAAFIFVNSVAGLLGVEGNAFSVIGGNVPWIAAALLGGVLGGYVGAERFSQLRLRQVLGGVLFFASIKLFFA